MKTPWWLIAFVFLLELLIVVILVPGRWTDRAIQQEMQLINQYYGRGTVSWAEGQAQNWYQRAMIDSGLYRAMRTFAIPSEQQKRRSKGLEEFGAPIFRWVEGRIEAVSSVVYQFMVRASMVKLWLPYMLLLLLPALYDGIMTRKIKQTDYAYSSPTLHLYSVRILLGTLLLLSLSFFLPLAVNPMLIPMCLVICCVCIGTAWSHTQKRI